MEEQAQSPIDPKTGLLREEVAKLLEQRADADPHLKRLMDNARAMQAAPVVAGLTEISQLRGGGALNMNPMLAWASGLPGAPKNLEAIAKSNPHRSPSDILQGLMKMGGAASSAQANYVKERDKFKARQMGGGSGGSGLGFEERLALMSAAAANKGSEKQDDRQLTKLLADNANSNRLQIAEINRNAALNKEQKAAAIKALEKKQKDEKYRLENEQKLEIRTRKEMKDFNSDNTVIGVRDSFDTLKTMSDTLRNYKIGDDLPGIGLLDTAGPEGVQWAKDKAYAFIKGKPDSWADDAQTMRQFNGKIVNIKNKMTNSTRATDKDYDRVVRAEGFGRFQSEKQALASLIVMRNKAKAALYGQLADLSPQARHEYDTRAGSIQPEDFDQLVFPGEKPRKRTQKKGKTLTPEAAANIKAAMEAAGATPE